jgi:predicted CXXCH cytochrome family protein
VHGPVAEGKCVECHDPHQSENASLQKKTSPELCFSCHDSALKDAQGHTLPAIKSLFENKELLHHLPFAEGKCSECHQPHMSVNRRLLTETYPAEFYASYSTEAYGLCYDCHDSKAFDAPRTLTDTRFRNGNLNLHHRHVNREKGRTCGACHSPHVSVQDNLVSQTFQFGSKTLPLRFKKTETGGSCTSACHGPLKYDFCQPEVITLRTTPRQGVDATAKALQLSCEKEKQKGKQEQKE